MDLPHRGRDRRPAKADAPRRDVVPFGQATRAWFAISLQTFGGPAGQIAVMQRALVDERRWIGQRRFLHALNFCMLLPGPEAQQLAVYVGWLLNGTAGGLVAGILFVLPGVVALLALSWLYVGLGSTAVVTALFVGLGASVLAVVAQAVVRVGRRALRHPLLVALAVAAFVALTVFAVPFPIVVVGAGVIGWAGARFTPRLASTGHDEPADGLTPLVPDDALHAARPSARHALAVLAVGAVAWAVPLVVVVTTTGTGSVFTQQGLFFSGSALVTFGGAYAVLAYVAQKAVETFHWLSATEMTRGLALAETTPGPLIMVVQFVAFVGAYRNPGSLDPWVAAVIGALLTTWVTFVPCFVFVFLGAPFIERLRGNRQIAAALTGITAAVVGVIANLAYFFALHTVFGEVRTFTAGVVRVAYPQLTSVHVVALVIAVVAAVLVFAVKWPVLRVLGVSAVLGVVTVPLGLA